MLVKLQIPLAHVNGDIEIKKSFSRCAFSVSCELFNLVACLKQSLGLVVTSTNNTKHILKICSICFNTDLFWFVFKGQEEILDAFRSNWRVDSRRMLERVRLNQMIFKWSWWSGYQFRALSRIWIRRLHHCRIASLTQLNLKVGHVKRFLNELSQSAQSVWWGF